jgi:Pentapeptide repeats (8 copies)
MSQYHAVTLGRYLADVLIGAVPPQATAPAQSPGSTTPRPKKQNNSHRADSSKGWIRSSLWPWPAIAITAIALAGALFGWLGAVVVAGQTVATLLFVAGDTLLERDKRARLAVSAVVAGAAVALLMLWQLHTIGVLRTGSSHHASRPTDLTGRIVSQAMLKRLNLRGAMLSGAQLDHLNLTSKSLNGAVAPGSSFVGSDLRRVAMRGADFPGANFTGACLRDADLAGAVLNGVTITGADITGVHLPRSVRKTLVGKPAAVDAHVSSCQ